MIIRRMGSTGLLVLILSAVSCDSTGPDLADGACVQTFEFGNYGCARFLVFVDGPDQPWPARYQWDVRARPAGSVINDGTLRVAPEQGVAFLEVTLYTTPPGSFGDTASYWVVGKLLEDPWPPVAGAPLPVFAADSVLRRVRFAEVGQVPPTDTLHLALESP